MSRMKNDTKIIPFFPGVSNGDLTLQEVVEGLGSSLTHTNVAERAVGTRFLADILHSLPQNKLNADELTFLTAFFVDRLKDHHSVVPNVIYAVLALVSCLYYLGKLM